MLTQIQEFQETLEPECIRDVVPDEILQGMMKGFFYGQRAGMVLIYDRGKDANGDPILERLEPVSEGADDWRNKFENFNPFCAKFRLDPKRNALCEACDRQRAQKVLSGGPVATRYKCHMGLIDMTVPIKVDGVIRGVVYGGQRVEDTEKSIQFIREQVESKSPSLFAELNAELQRTKQSPGQLERFERSFLKFADGLQKTVELSHKSKLDDAERKAILAISQDIGRAQADDAEGWLESASRLLNQLEGLVKGALWLLVRRGSRYECMAKSPAARSTPDNTIPVATVISLANETIERHASGTLIQREISNRFGLGDTFLTIVRSDCPVSTSDTASILLVIGADIQPRLGQFIIGCARALSYPAGVTLLFRKLDKQQSEFQRNMAFTGHHLKTPLQAARFTIEEAIMLAEEDVAANRECLPLLKDAVDQLVRALADALKLQASAKASERERINVVGLIRELIDDFEPLARRRSNVIRMLEVPTSTCSTSFVRLHLRVAFSNLLDNAIKYSYEGKTVDIRMTPIAMQVKSASGRHRIYLKVEIDNYGVGFSQEYSEQLFSPGFRAESEKPGRKRVGEGIGLWQAKEYIEAAGGTLDIRSHVVVAKTATSGGMHKVTVSCLVPLLEG